MVKSRSALSTSVLSIMTTTPYSTLSALSPLDGRYAGKTDLLRPSCPKPASCTTASK
jgi:hypothetical protein